jgi:hypothetical protein
MHYKFLRCTNPHFNHVKLLYGSLIDEWNELFCECGHKFEEPQEEFYKVFTIEESFMDVDPEGETKIIPIIPIRTQ